MNTNKTKNRAILLGVPSFICICIMMLALVYVIFDFKFHIPNLLIALYVISSIVLITNFFIIIFNDTVLRNGSR